MTASRPTVSLTAHEPGASVSKFLVCLYEAGGNVVRAAELAAERCRSTPLVEHALRHLVTKAAVGAGSTAGVGWAQELAPYGIGTEILTLLQSASIWGRLAPLCRRAPFRVKTAREVGAGGNGAWRGEGLPAPVTKTTTDTLTLDAFVSDYIVVVTRELFKFGAVAEALLRDTVIAGLARWLDGQLLDPTVAQTAAHPASLTHGTEVLTSSGATAANIATDLAALLAAIQSSGDHLVWVMRPLTYSTIAAKLASVGWPSERGYLLSIPVVLGSTSPHQIALLDCANVMYAADDALTLDVTTNADVQMDGAPTQSGVSGTGSTMISLFQSGLVGVRAGFAVNWQHVHFNNASPSVPSGAAVMAVAY